MPALRRTLEAMYRRMEARYGPTGWWPGENPFEIAVGAILTQNTAWTNVEKAIERLKDKDLLSPERILDAPEGVLEEAIRPSGYFNLKAKRLRGFCRYLLGGYGGSMEAMAREPLETLRPELLAVYGIGPETADDILLYALDKPVFVVDAYTRRILARHGVCPPDIGYEALRALFEDHLPPDAAVWREYHALLVFVGKDYCRKAIPRCPECPLRPLLKPGQPLAL
jgi:endonuclease-3 related protein